MGPLASMFGQLMDKRRAGETEALRARMGADDPGGPIYLDSKPSPLPVVTGWDWQTGQNQTPPFRGPEMEAGPSPPTGPLSALYGGQLSHGNIDIMHRPQVHNRDGSTSTVRSMSFNEGGPEILVPTVADDGSRILSDDDAIAQYHRTGRHLGTFSTPDAATTFAGRLHDQQQALGDARALSSGDRGPEARRALRLTSQTRPGGPLAGMFGDR